MKRIFSILAVLLTFYSVSVAQEPELRAYYEYEMPAGYNIPVISLQEFSTAYTEEGEPLQFVTTTDIFMFDKVIIPEKTILTGYIDKKNEPIIGTNASMKVFINKMRFPDGYETPIKAYVYTANNNLIGGELTLPETYIKMPHYQTWTLFRAMGVSQFVPGDKRRMGEHVTISSGSNLTVELLTPIYMTHLYSKK